MTIDELVYQVVGAVPVCVLQSLFACLKILFANLL